MIDLGEGDALVKLQVFHYYLEVSDLQSLTAFHVSLDEIAKVNCVQFLKLYVKHKSNAEIPR